MKKQRLTALCLAAALAGTLASPACAAPSDVPQDAWYAQAVDYSLRHGLFSGTSPDTFEPDAPMTRAMFLTVLGHMSGVQSQAIWGDAPFSDISMSSWYGPFVSWGAAYDITGGFPDGTFSPDQAVTREQMAVFLCNYLDALGLILPGSGSAVERYTDEADISLWARDAVTILRASGLASGDGAGRFRPQATLSRCEAAQILMRLNMFLETGSIQGGEPSGRLSPVALTAAQPSSTLQVGENTPLSIFLTPASSSSPLRYESSDPSIAQVDEYGNVTGRAPGSAAITVTAQNDLSVTVQITVSSGTAQPDSVYLNDLQTAMTDLVNDTRLQVQADPLTYQPGLQAAADLRAREEWSDLLSGESGVHVRTDGRPWYTVGELLSPDLSLAAENMLYIQGSAPPTPTSPQETAQSLLEQWLESQRDRDNLLNLAHRGYALGLCQGTTDQGFCLVACQLFSL